MFRCNIFFVILGWKRGWRKVAGLLLVEYVFLIYYSTVICRKVAEGIAGHNFIPLWSYEAIKNGREDLVGVNIMNVVVFVPIGLLLNCVSRRLKWWMVLLVGFGISVSIEVLQFFFHKGFSDVDDVKHKTHIELSETGTKAAATTAVVAIVTAVTLALVLE